MTANAIPIRDSDGSVAPDIKDELDNAIDATWALIGLLESICRESGDDPFLRGAVRIANDQCDRLANIRHLLVGESQD